MNNFIFLLMLFFNCGSLQADHVDIKLTYNERMEVIEPFVEEAVDVFNLSKKDIFAIIHIESKGKAKVRGRSGEYGLMQITSPLFEKYGNKINDILKNKGVEQIEWSTDSDKLDIRNNIIVGSYLFSLKKKRHKGSSIFAAMAHNVGDYGAEMTRKMMNSTEEHWYCFKINPGIRIGRQINYAKKFARKSNRMAEWNELFGDIPDEFIEALPKGRAETRRVCNQLISGVVILK